MSEALLTEYLRLKNQCAKASDMPNYRVFLSKKILKIENQLPMMKYSSVPNRKIGEYLFFPDNSIKGKGGFWFHNPDTEHESRYKIYGSDYKETLIFYRLLSEYLDNNLTLPKELIRFEFTKDQLIEILDFVKAILSESNLDRETILDIQ